jgi:hypothetical protein
MVGYIVVITVFIREYSFIFINKYGCTSYIREAITYESLSIN